MAFGGVALGRWLAAALLLALAACAAPAPPPAATPTPPPATATAVPVAIAPTRTASPTPRPAFNSQIAFAGRDDQLYTVNPDGSGLRQISPLEPKSSGSAAPLRRVYNWPTWSPDGARIAYMRFNYDSEGDLGSAEVLVADRDGAHATRLYASEAGGPIYLAWSPDGSYLALLVQETDTLRLLISDGRSEAAKPAASGNPLYIAWAPDSRRMLLHVGGDQRAPGALSLAEPADPAGTARDLHASPNLFRAPAWLRDGQRAVWSELGGDGEGVLWLGAPERGPEQALAHVGAAPAFVVSPTRDEVAFGEPARPGRPIYDGISLVRPGAAPVRLVDEDVVAFFWSPDGEWLAYVGTDAPADDLTWHVIRRDGAEQLLLRRFTPGRTLTQYLVYFDQYAQSTSVWSPDARSLLVTTAERDPNGRMTSRILAVPIDGGPEVSLGEGRIATWSPVIR